MSSTSVAFTHTSWPCIGLPRNIRDRGATSSFPTSSFRARRPALLPASNSLSLSDTEDVFRRTQQPIFPPPNLHLARDIESVPTTAPDIPVTTAQLESKVIQPRQTRESSPRSSYDLGTETTTIPPALARDANMCGAWLNARIQYAAADVKSLDSLVPNEGEEEQCPMGASISKTIDGLRKHSTFVQEEELECLLNDQVGTSHTSDLQIDDDMSPHSKMHIGGVSSVEPPAADLVTEMPGEIALDDSTR